MHSQLSTIACIAPGRLIGAGADGALRLVWGDVSFRLPVYDLPHLTALLDDWCAEEELPGLRRGYYRLLLAPDGGVQLWFNNAGLCLSRDELRLLAGLLRAAEQQLDDPAIAQPARPFGIGYRKFAVAPGNSQWRN